jgi:hypothetical protein
MSFPDLGFLNEQVTTLLIAFYQQSYFFELIAGQVDGADTNLYFLALTAGLIGALMILLIRKFQKLEVIIPWLLVLILTLLGPYASSLLFYKIGVDDPLLTQPVSSMEGVYVTPEGEQLMNGQTITGDGEQRASRVFPDGSAAEIRAFLPQLLAIDIPNRLHRAIHAALFEAGPNGHPRVRNMLGSRVGADAFGTDQAADLSNENHLRILVWQYSALCGRNHGGTRRSLVNNEPDHLSSLLRSHFTYGQLAEVIQDYVTLIESGQLSSLGDKSRAPIAVRGSSSESEFNNYQQDPLTSWPGGGSGMSTTARQQMEYWGIEPAQIRPLTADEFAQLQFGPSPNGEPTWQFLERNIDSARGWFSSHSLESALNYLLGVKTGVTNNESVRQALQNNVAISIGDHGLGSHSAVVSRPGSAGQYVGSFPNFQVKSCLGFQQILRFMLVRSIEIKLGMNGILTVPNALTPSYNAQSTNVFPAGTTARLAVKQQITHIPTRAEIARSMGVPDSIIQQDTPNSYQTEINEAVRKFLFERAVGVGISTLGPNAVVAADAAQAANDRFIGDSRNAIPGQSVGDWDVVQGIVGIAANVGVFLGSILAGAGLQAYVMFLDKLISFALGFVVMVTPFLFLIALTVPGYASGILIITVLAPFTIAFISLTFTIINAFAHLFYDVMQMSGSSIITDAFFIIIVAVAYTTSAGMAVFLLFGLGNPSSVIQRIAQMDQPAKQVADSATNTVKNAAVKTGLLVGGAGAVYGGAVMMARKDGKTLSASMQAGDRQLGEFVESFGNTLPFIKEFSNAGRQGRAHADEIEGATKSAAGHEFDKTKAKQFNEEFVKTHGVLASDASPEEKKAYEAKQEEFIMARISSDEYESEKTAYIDSQMRELNRSKRDFDYERDVFRPDREYRDRKKYRDPISNEIKYQDYYHDHIMESAKGQSMDDIKNVGKRTVIDNGMKTAVMDRTKKDYKGDSVDSDQIYSTLMSRGVVAKLANDKHDGDIQAAAHELATMMRKLSKEFRGKDNPVGAYDDFKRDKDGNAINRDADRGVADYETGFKLKAAALKTEIGQEIKSVLQSAGKTVRTDSDGNMVVVNNTYTGKWDPSDTKLKPGGGGPKPPSGGILGNQWKP